MTDQTDIHIPETDDEKAAAALYVAMSIALNPLVGNANQLAAANIVLNFCKAKPAVKQDVRINTAEKWLAEVQADMVRADMREAE
jgi:hypothetical protein